MTKSKFQLVGSLLRPADLRKFKDEIESRDDIQYPFYDALPGYQETETADIKQIVAEQKEKGTLISFGVSKESSAILLTTVTPLKTMMAAPTKPVRISVSALQNPFQVKIITS